MTRVGIEPTTYGLTYHFGFRRPLSHSAGSSWSGLSLCLHPRKPAPAVGQAPAVQSLHLPRARFHSARLGSGLAFQRSPTLTGFTVPFLTRCSFFEKSVALPIELPGQKLDSNSNRQAIARTTPPSTRNAAPVVAVARALQM